MEGHPCRREGSEVLLVRRLPGEAQSTKLGSLKGSVEIMDLSKLEKRFWQVAWRRAHPDTPPLSWYYPLTPMADRNSS